jgi:hypothetical protein
MAPGRGTFFESEREAAFRREPKPQPRQRSNAERCEESRPTAGRERRLPLVSIFFFWRENRLSLFAPAKFHQNQGGRGRLFLCEELSA